MNGGTRGDAAFLKESLAKNFCEKAMKRFSGLAIQQRCGAGQGDGGYGGYAAFLKESLAKNL